MRYEGIRQQYDNLSYFHTLEMRPESGITDVDVEIPMDEIETIISKSSTIPDLKA